MTDADDVKRLQRLYPRGTSRRVRSLTSLRRLALRRARVLIAPSLVPVLISCDSHPAYDLRRQGAPSPNRGDVRVVTVRGDVLMIRSAVVPGDTMSGERIFCEPGWGTDETWCK